MNEQPTIQSEFNRRINKNMEVYARIIHKIKTIGRKKLKNKEKLNETDKTEVDNNESR